MFKRSGISWTWLSLVALASGSVFSCGSSGASSDGDAPADSAPADDEDLGFTGSTGAGGTSDPGGEEACESVSQLAENQVRPIDIIWAIDTSPSMTAEKNAVRDNLNLFASQIAAAQIDVHVVMIASLLSDGGICVDAPLGSGNCPNDHQPPTYHHNPQWVGSHNALGRFIGEYGEYKSALRQTATKYFVVVTDDSSHTDAASFTASVNQLDAGWWEDWKVFALYCQYQDAGNVYQTLVSQTGGIGVELCQAAPNWQTVFDGFVADVLNNKSLDCKWEIPEPPDGQEFDREKVNVTYTAGGSQTAENIYFAGDLASCGPQGGWYYDDPDNPTAIEVCPTTCQAIQSDVEGKIDIQFGCKTEWVPK